MTTTGVDTPIFNTLWLEISAVLVALGLDQTEIDRLEAEPFGEDDYLDVLRGWNDSEQDIKSQLKDIHQSQTETQQDVCKVLQSRLEDHKTLQESISKVDELQKIEINTNKVINESRQTQLEDHKTLQESVVKLEGISQTQTETRQVVEEKHETLQASLQEIKQEVENLKERKEMERAEEVLRNLAKSEFKGDIECHAKRFQKGTREWIFKRVDDWLDDRSSQNRVMVISGCAGMGKSVISSIICKRMQEAGRLLGNHFCQHNNVRYRKPQLMLQSLAFHLSQALPEYKDALVDQLSRNLGEELNSMGVEELFALLFKEPLSKVADPGRNLLIVIDGLDESEYQGRNDLLDVIVNQFSKLPQWMRFMVTTRPEIYIADSLKHFQPIQLEDNRDENERDIQLFFEMQLSQEIEQEDNDVLLRRLVDKSEGVFLYAYFLTDFIKKNVSILTPEQLESSLPLDISSVYQSHFKRLENELCKELKIEEDQMLSFLCGVSASREPLPVAFVSRLLGLSDRPLSVQRKLNKAIASISSLLPVRDDCLHFFHKSVKDWLTNTFHYGRHDFIVEEKEGHGILFDLCRNELDNIKRRGVHDAQFSDTERYALQHGVQHMTEVDELGEKVKPCSIEELVSMYVTDLELIYAKLCVKSTAYSEDIRSVQKHFQTALFSEQSRSLLFSLLKLFRKHSYLLRDYPHLWFQSLINDGSPELSSRASAILEERLLSVPYMKYLDKADQNGAVQARVYCSDTVACFDISPEMDYMVCECRDGTINLWSLETGNKVWTRHSLLERQYDCVHPYEDVVGDGGAYRAIMPELWDTGTQRKFPVLTFYRSVVFHPSGKSVLPGTLRKAYTLEGDCKDLFPKSNCTFSYCIFPRDKRTILTDCFDDPKTVALWSIETGEELRRIPWNDVISSFAISPDGSQIAFGDLTGFVYLVHVHKWQGECLFKCKNAACGLMHFTPDNKALVCGYLCYRIEGLGFRQYGWVYMNKTEFCLCEINRNLATLLPSRPCLFPSIDFVLWPIEPRTLVRKEFFHEGLLSSWVNNVYSVFPSLQTGFYKKLNKETALVGSPSFNYVATVNVDLLNKVTSRSRREVVKEVVFSFKEDAIYSISSGENDNSVSEILVTVLRMSNQEILVKKTFACSSLSLIPMKEGALLCYKHQVPELWNFELTECIRPIPRLKGAEKFICLSDELIACHLPRGILTSDELSDCGHPAEVEDSLELHKEDESVEQDESLVFDDSSNEGVSSVLEDFFLISGLPVIPPLMPPDLIGEIEFSRPPKRFDVFQVLAVDVINVTSGECVSSIKTEVLQDDDLLFISSNSHNQLLVCTSEEIDNDAFGMEQLTVSLRNNGSLEPVWERSTKRYDDRSFTPEFIFSSDEEFVVTWGSFYSGHGLHILDATNGETRLILLKDQDDIVDCKFVDNGDTLVCCSEDNFVRLFNVRSGDLLSQLDIEEHPYCVGACLGKPLVAIGLSGARLKFIHVELPRVKDAEGKKG